MEDLIGLRLDAFRMAKHAITFYFSGQMNGIQKAFRVATDWDINFDPNEDYTNKTGETAPKLAKIWSYVETNLSKFNLAENGLSCSFYFEDRNEPLVIWKDPNQWGELLIVTDETKTNFNWWVI